MARTAGDAAAAAYLHPIIKVRQVGHILRAAACTARIGELSAGGDPEVGDRLIRRAREGATPVVEVLTRYPMVIVGKDRVAQLMSSPDACLR